MNSRTARWRNHTFQRRVIPWLLAALTLISAYYSATPASAAPQRPYVTVPSDDNVSANQAVTIELPRAGSLPEAWKEEINIDTTPYIQELREMLSDSDLPKLLKPTCMFCWNVPRNKPPEHTTIVKCFTSPCFIIDHQQGLIIWDDGRTQSIRANPSPLYTGPITSVPAMLKARVW